MPHPKLIFFIIMLRTGDVITGEINILEEIQANTDALCSTLCYLANKDFTLKRSKYDRSKDDFVVRATVAVIYVTVAYF
jgi:hypothetical protein